MSTKKGSMTQGGLGADGRGHKEARQRLFMVARSHDNLESKRDLTGHCLFDNKQALKEET
jgi:hypothetical protein